MIAKVLAARPAFTQRQMDISQQQAPTSAPIARGAVAGRQKKTGRGRLLRK
jgi:hypothetical protein